MYLKSLGFEENISFESLIKCEGQIQQTIDLLTND